MSDTITLPPSIINVTAPAQSKWEREHEAFGQLLPHLLKTHPGKYVAIHGGHVFDSGDNKLALAMRVLSRIGNTDIHVGLVTNELPPVARSGVRHDSDSHLRLDVLP